MTQCCGAGYRYFEVYKCSGCGVPECRAVSLCRELEYLREGSRSRCEARGLEYLMVKGVVYHGGGVQTMELGQGYS